MKVNLPLILLNEDSCVEYAYKNGRNREKLLLWFIKTLYLVYFYYIYVFHY